MTEKKQVLIPAIPEKHVELYKMYGPSLWLNDIKLEASVYIQYSTIEGFAQQGLVKKFLTLKDAKDHMVYKVQKEINTTQDKVNKLKSLLNDIEKDKFKLKELDDDIKGQG